MLLPVFALLQALNTVATGGQAIPLAFQIGRQIQLFLQNRQSILRLGRIIGKTGLSYERHMRKRKYLRTRQLEAFACLVAILLLQAPFAGAAWIAAASSCCMSDQCSIPGHHHKNAPPKEDTPMDCGHGMNHQADCKISCCKTTDETAISVEPFVLPDAQFVFSLSAVSPDASDFVSQMISRSEKPLSPPPKNLFS